MARLTLIRITRDTGVLLLVAAALLVSIGAVGPDPGSLLLGVVTAGAGLATLGVFAITEHRLRRLALSHDCRLCPRCLQPILHRTDRCPECGEPVDMFAVFTAWRRFALRGETRHVRALQRRRP